MRDSMLSITRPPQAVTERHALTRDEFMRLAVIDQLKVAFRPSHRLAAAVGLVQGGIVPCLTWAIITFAVSVQPALWILVAGGLVYSGISVFEWIYKAHGNPFKAAAFVLILEGSLAFVPIHAVNLTVLGVLVFINAIAASCLLQVNQTEASANGDGVTSLGLTAPSVTVSVQGLQQNAVTPSPSLGTKRSSRAKSPAERARAYRQRKKLERAS